MKPTNRVIAAVILAWMALSCSHQHLQTQNPQAEATLNCESSKRVQYGYAGVGWGGPGMATAFYR